MKSKIYDLKEVKSRIRLYCAKEDRCQQQVINKLLDYGVSSGVSGEILLDLIQEKYVDEERYARSFCSGKFKINKWGRRKIIFELKKKKVSEACIQMGLEEIDEEEYLHILKQLLEKKKDLSKENNQFVRKKKMVDYVVRKGYESDLVWEVVHNL